MISRPVSWLNTAYPFAAGYIVSGGSFDATLIIGTFFFLIPYNLLMYGVNDVFDYESDIRNPRKGGIEGAVTAKSFHPTILWSVVITTIPYVIVLILLGNALSSVVLLSILFFVVAYSLKGLRFKEKPVLDSITSSLHFVGPLMVGLACTGFQTNALPFVVGFFLWGMASHAFGAVQDIIPDREAKLSSIATIFGARATVWFALVAYASASILVGVQGGLAWLVGVAGIAYLINIWPYRTITDTISATSRPGWRRFIWVNYFVGFIVTIVLILTTFLS